jgi:hypothetical protein
VNAPLVTLQNKNTNNAKSEVRFLNSFIILVAFTIDSSRPTLTGSFNMNIRCVQRYLFGEQVVVCDIVLQKTVVFRTKQREFFGFLGVRKFITLN